MNFIYLITSILFFIWIIRNILFWVSLWQIKEYRLDRVLVHFRETKQGKMLFLNPLSLIKNAAFILYIVNVFNNKYLLVSEIFVLSIFLIQDFFVFKEALQRLIKRPVFTLKAILILLLTISVLIVLYSIPLFEKFIWLVFLDRLIPFIVAFFVFLFYLPTEMYRDWKIDKAIQKVASYKKMLVIGVTGSYGKSSTKEYISQILEKKFKVLKTKGTNNTPIGIANTILSGLKKGTEIFVVEMGAYKIGEIAQMCKIVHPKIGVLTAVNEQHLSLFGSMKNTMRAKYELMESLPDGGLGLFNANNKNSFSLYQKYDRDKILYKIPDSGRKDQDSKADIYATNIHVKKTSIEFDVIIGKKIIHLTAPFIGIHNVENLLPAIFIAEHLGMPVSEIQNAVLSLMPLQQTMILKKMKNGSAIVDDTFNANPNAVLAALNYMKVYKGKKILVLQPMIELGNKGDLEHFRIAREISKICDYLFLTNKNFSKSILKGITEGEGKCIMRISSSSEIADFVSNSLSKEDIAVFEGKEAGIVLNKLSF